MTTDALGTPTRPSFFRQLAVQFPATLLGSLASSQTILSVPVGGLTPTSQLIIDIAAVLTIAPAQASVFGYVVTYNGQLVMKEIHNRGAAATQAENLRVVIVNQNITTLQVGNYLFLGMVGATADTFAHNTFSRAANTSVPGQLVVTGTFVTTFAAGNQLAPTYAAVWQCG